MTKALPRALDFVGDELEQTVPRKLPRGPRHELGGKPRLLVEGEPRNTTGTSAGIARSKMIFFRRARSSAAKLKLATLKDSR